MDDKTLFLPLPTSEREILLPALRTLTIDDYIVLIIGFVTALIYLWNSKSSVRSDFWYARPQALLSGQDGTSTKSATRDISTKIEQTGAKVILFWSSQSGTSEDVAARLGQELRNKFQLPSLTADTSEYDLATFSKLPKDIVLLFFMSTYGEGNPADNGVQFMNWLEKDTPQVFQSMSYATVGFGNSDYKHFNRVVDVLEEQLQRVGAKQLLPTLRLDAAQNDSREAYLDWKPQLFNVMKQLLALEECQTSSISKFAVRSLSSAEPEKYRLEGDAASTTKSTRPADDKPEYYDLPIKQAQCIAKYENQACVHFDLDLTQYRKLKYRTGDCLLIWPNNPPALVEQLLDICGLQPTRSDLLEITTNSSIEPETDSRKTIPSSTNTVEQLFTSKLDLSSRQLSRDIVSEFAAYAPAAEARERLTHLTRNKDTFAQIRQMNIVELLLHIDNSHKWAIPLPFLLTVLPQLKPRYYSISSSSAHQPRQASITVSIDEAAPGLSTGYLLAKSDAWQTHSQQNARNIEHPLSVRASLYHPPRNSQIPASQSTPLLLIGAGTGIAPLRAFVRERTLIHRLRKSSPLGKTMLFFGCRNEDSFLYRSELLEDQALLGGEEFLEIHSAYSRVHASEQNEGRVKYVQDSLRHHKESVVAMICGDIPAAVYICGSAKMARGVTGVLEDIVRAQNRWSSGEWEAWKEGRRKGGKWIEDAW